MIFRPRVGERFEDYVASQKEQRDSYIKHLKETGQLPEKKEKKDEKTTS